MARKATRRSSTTGRKASKSKAPSKAARKTLRVEAVDGEQVVARDGVEGGSRLRAKPKDLGDLFLETLKDIYHAEKQILRRCRKWRRRRSRRAASGVPDAYGRRRTARSQRLEQIFEMSGKRPQAKPCHAIMGLVEEGNEVMEEFKGSDALDAGLLAAAQAVEHYEISRYGTLKSWAAAAWHARSQLRFSTRRLRKRRRPTSSSPNSQNPRSIKTRVAPPEHSYAAGHCPRTFPRVVI